MLHVAYYIALYRIIDELCSSSFVIALYDVIFEVMKVFI